MKEILSQILYNIDMTRVRNLIRLIVISIRHFVLSKIYRMNIAKSARISYSAKLDKTNPRGVYIGEESYISGGGNNFYARLFKSIA